MSGEFERHTVALTVRDASVSIDAIFRHGTELPMVFLHGFGSTKEDYADFVRRPAFANRAFLAYDAPGCGRTFMEHPEQVSIPFLVETALQMLEEQAIDRFHLVGHSMGGLTALMLADAIPQRVLSFANIEGNVAPEDCFLSRQIVDYPAEDDQTFFDAFIDRAHRAPAWSSPLYATSLPHKVRTGAVRGIFSSMVELSDHGGLMDRFLGLPCPTLFMYGEQNDSLSYLELLRGAGVTLAPIAQCGHFPMYSNPVQMWRELEAFVSAAEALPNSSTSQSKKA